MQCAFGHCDGVDSLIRQLVGNASAYFLYEATDTESVLFELLIDPLGYFPTSNRWVAFQPEHLSRRTAGTGSCTRICARVTMLLLVTRKCEVDRENSHFSLVNRSFFETKMNALKATISES